MKQQFVDMLEEGDYVSDYFIAARKDLRDLHSGGKFLGMVFKDRTGEIGGVLWQNAPAVAKLFEVGDVVRVRGTVNTYQDRLQIRVDQVLPLRESEYDLADLALALDNAEDLYQALTRILGQVEDPWLRKLVDAFLEDEAFVEQFKAAAAGKKWHHAYRGGLLEHCHEMARCAETMCELFSGINRDLLLTAVLVHDIGKLEEMSHGAHVDYTSAGKLLGHLAIGMDMVQRRIDALEGFPENLRLQLLHCVLAHHGELQTGSPVLPKTLEALVLYHCDNMSAQTNAFNRVVAETKDRERVWSDYIGMIGRQIWTRDED
ncbi:MAG: 3'-5' exoribonuclease YhaM family protein [Candidatus Hydrogenedentota bacterium]